MADENRNDRYISIVCKVNKNEEEEKLGTKVGEKKLDQANR